MIGKEAVFYFYGQKKIMTASLGKIFASNKRNTLTFMVENKVILRMNQE